MPAARVTATCSYLSLSLALLLPVLLTASVVNPTTNGVGVATCAAKPANAHQVWSALSERPLSPISTLGGGSCISAVGCATRSPTCYLSAEPCNSSDPFQLFSFNASTGIVQVPPGA
eukprot:COSAG06_NODE_25580_length_633_cov_1.284644_1_plen_116_part_10